MSLVGSFSLFVLLSKICFANGANDMQKRTNSISLHQKMLCHRAASRHLGEFCHKASELKVLTNKF